MNHRLYKTDSKVPLTREQRLHDALVIAEEHLAQYRVYSEAMCEFGRGFTPSSAYSPESLSRIVTSAIFESGR